MTWPYYLSKAMCRVSAHLYKLVLYLARSCKSKASPTTSKILKIDLSLSPCFISSISEHVPRNLPSNVKVFSWIPQNDILAYQSTKLFISHTGHNSLYESAFYGVLLLCTPLFADQLSNRIQAQVVGMGVGIDIKKMEEDEIYQKIQLVLNNPR